MNLDNSKAVSSPAPDSQCNSGDEGPPQLDEMHAQLTPVKQANSRETATPYSRNRKRTANAMSERVPVQDVVRTLTDPDHGLYPTGVSPKQLLAYILTMPEQQRPAVRKNWLQVQISRAYTQGSLVRVGPKRGRYTHIDLLPQYEQQGLLLDDTKNGRESVAPLSVSNGHSHSPDDSSGPLSSPESVELDTVKHRSSSSPHTRKNHRSSPGYRNHNGVDSLPVCDICLRPAAMNMSGISETFLVCSECTAKAHPSCLNYSAELIESCRKSDWQCSECKTCMMCSSSEELNNNVLLFCDFCDRACHMLCNKVPLIEKPSGKWMCDWCSVAARQTKSSSTKKRTCPAKTIQDSDREVVRNYGLANTFPSCECIANSVVRDLSSDAVMTKSAEEVENWSADRVCTFLTDLGFTAEAPTFKEQDIDGPALLLLTRDDIVGRMSFKLGPALRIHRYAFALQTAYSRTHCV